MGVRHRHWPVCLAFLLGGAVLGLPVSAGTAFPLTVTDALGRRITVAAPPRRIISVAPSVTEILFALGLDDRIVAVSAADDYPPQKVASRPRVGGVVLDVERIVGLRPDLVVGVAGLQRTQLERLIALHLPVVAVDAASLPDVYAQMVLLGRVTGRTEAAAAAVGRMRRRESAVAQAVGRVPPRRVYVELWGEPLTAAGGGTFIADLVRRAGGANIFADVRGWPQVSAEAVITRNPEVIILTYPHSVQVLGRRGWEHVAAIRTRRVAEVDASLVSRPGPRVVEGLERLARIIHPEVFP